MNRKHFVAMWAMLPFLIQCAWAQCPTGTRLSAVNFIPNGNFEEGAKRFKTAYKLATTKNGMVPEGTYAVAKEIGDLHHDLTTCGDHTSGKGKMLLVNGAIDAERVVWEQQTCVPSMTLLSFSVWVSNMGSSAPWLEVRVNGKAMTNSKDVVIDECDWVELYFQWHSNTDTTVNIQIVNLNTNAGGNDFVLDDIALIGCFPESQKDIPCGMNPFYSKNEIPHLNETITLNNVQFAQSKYDLDSLSRTDLDRVAAWLLLNPKMRIELSGHTSNEGSDAKNFTLSEQRVQACKTYIVQKGINGDRIQAVAHGETKPAHPNTTLENRKKNRRVELKILAE